MLWVDCATAGIAEKCTNTEETMTNHRPILMRI